MKLEGKIGLVVRQFRQKVENKYNILDMKLFGSTARGDFSKNPDDDIMIKLPFEP
jgi:predicted nucleotidyltransferase